MQFSTLTEWRAEILAERGAWYLLQTQPGCERLAAAHLAARRFGCYLPEIDERSAAGELVRRTPLFHRYVFVYLWGLAAHVPRVRSVPGVAGFVLRNGEPCPVPDRIIADVMAIEFREWLTSLPRGLFRRRRHREHHVVPYWYATNYGFGGASSLEDRTDALRRALGLG